MALKSLFVGNNLSHYNVVFSTNISRFYFLQWQCLICQRNACCDDAVSINLLVILKTDYFNNRLQLIKRCSPIHNDVTVLDEATLKEPKKKQNSSKNTEKNFTSALPHHISGQELPVKCSSIFRVYP